MAPAARLPLWYKTVELMVLITHYLQKVVSIEVFTINLYVLAMAPVQFDVVLSLGNFIIIFTYIFFGAITSHLSFFMAVLKLGSRAKDGNW